MKNFLSNYHLYHPQLGSTAQQHLLRVYYQVQIWLGKNLNPEQWEWMMDYNILEPIMTLLPPAPNALLNIIFCNCIKRLWYLLTAAAEKLKLNVQFFGDIAAVNHVSIQVLTIF